ncbi:hypothetical protein BC777_3617 [Yoonia maricola]|uniref:Ferrochelatase n=1 Tax=Yoonia maricola TaxID=420999 RepID=A0A2M8W0V9_9RHOB|nr:hypothetical protein [Yoonia maricola]PJI84556.1 hypothetical protein BC777_3617 [Yoonia maricola]
MRFTTTLAAAAAIAVSGVAANAGGLAQEVTEAPVVVAEPAPAPATSSVSPTYVVLGVLAALLIAAAVNEAD